MKFPFHIRYIFNSIRTEIDLLIGSEKHHWWFAFEHTSYGGFKVYIVMSKLKITWGYNNE